MPSGVVLFKFFCERGKSSAVGPDITLFNFLIKKN